MNYIHLINLFWKLNRKHCFNGVETQLYFKLLDICNQNDWQSFQRSNKSLCAETDMTEAKLITARNTLVEVGLIGFISGKKKREPSTYSILCNSIKNSNSNSNLNSDSDSNSYSDSDSQLYSDSDLNLNSDSDFDSAFLEKGEENDSAFFEKNEKNDSAFFQKAADNKRNINRNLNLNQEKEKRKKEIITASAVPLQLKNIIEKYNLACNRLPRVKELSQARKQAAGARLREFGPEKMHSMLQQAGESDFLAGANERNWVANFDWIMKPNNFVKILEGYYANRRKTLYNNKPSELEILEETYNDIIENGDFTD